MTTPFYKRELSSFADEIITRVRRRQDGFWHAVLDCGFDWQVADPDFGPYGYGASREEAAKRSAAAIRDDAHGIGEYAPHSLLVPGYDLHFRLMRHWEMKERFLDIGLDPNDVMIDVNEAAEKGEAHWALEGNWSQTGKAKRAFEFAFRLHVGEMGKSLMEGADPTEAKEVAISGIREIATGGRFIAGAYATDETWRLVLARVDAAALEFQADDTPGACF